MSAAPPPLAHHRVLLVEDNPGDSRLLEELLKAGDSKFEVIRTVRRLADAENALSEMEVDIVLLDLSLPDSSGIETLSRLQRHSPETPIVVLSGLHDEELAAQTVHRGAQDYLVKDQLEDRLLVRSMRYAIERKSSELALAHERMLLRELLGRVPDRIYFKDRESRFILINESMASLFGLGKPEDAIGKTDFDFFSPEHARPAFEDEQRVMQTGRAIVGRVEKETLPDGRVDWVSTTKMPLRDAQGNIVGTFGVSRVITRLKKMEEALNGERMLLRSVIDNLPDPIFVKDREGRYKLDNRAHAEFLGLKDGTGIVGKTVYDYFPDEIATRFDEDDRKVMETGEAQLNKEEKITDSNGSTRWQVTTKVPMRDAEGEVAGLVCIRRDVTEQKEAEDKLVEANTNLFTALSQLQNAHSELRSVQLQLIEAEKLKSIGRLAAGVAHEVKNPLAIMRMGIDYLGSQTFEDENVPTILHDLSDAVNRADSVIQGLLDFSAPQNLEVQVRDVNEIIRRALVLVRGEMNHSAHRVATELDPELRPVAVDMGKMSQVLVNLFTNSLHAMTDGGTLRVRTYCKQLTGVGSNVGDARSESFRVGDTMVVIEVEDDGPGIPEASLSKVFDPFYTTKPTGEGTGLGLSVAKSIIDLHRGTIAITNRPEGGAKVTIMLKS
jgi:PAS domain S-box-containing protein